MGGHAARGWGCIGGLGWVPGPTRSGGAQRCAPVILATWESGAGDHDAAGAYRAKSLSLSSLCSLSFMNRRRRKEGKEEEEKQLSVGGGIFVVPDLPPIILKGIYLCQD